MSNKITVNQTSIETENVNVSETWGYSTEQTLTDRKQFAYKGYVDDLIAGENYWDRNAITNTLTPHTPNDNVDIGTGNYKGANLTLIDMLLATPTYTTVKDAFDQFNSGGTIEHVTLAAGVGGDVGKVTYTAIKGYIKTSNSDNGTNKFFDLPAGTTSLLTDNSENYIYVDYNAGSPQVLVTTNRNNIRTTDQILLGRAYREGTSVDVLSSGIELHNFQRMEFERLIARGIMEHMSGSMIAEKATRYVTATAGLYYVGLNKLDVTAKDSSLANFEHYYYRDTPSGWKVVTPATGQIDNTHYDNGSGTLATLTNNRYGVHWVYQCFEGDLNVLFGQGDYTLNQANAAQPPSSVPDYLSKFSILIGKIIIQKNSATFTSIESAFIIPFVPTAVSDHNSLSGLQGGTASEYYHLTNTEYGGNWGTRNWFISAGTFGVSDVLGVSGAGTRIVWYPRKAAFRAGYVDSTQWDDANIGTYSIAIGDKTKASGDASVAFGRSSVASGPISCVVGYGVTAQGAYAFGCGYFTNAFGTAAFACGASTYAQAVYSMACGNNTTAQAYNSLVIGRWNVLAGDNVSWIATDPLFVGGNGTDSAHRSNAFVFYKNGNANLYGGLNIGTATGATAGKIFANDGGDVGSFGVNSSTSVDVSPMTIIFKIGGGNYYTFSQTEFTPSADLGAELGDPSYRFSECYFKAVNLGTATGATLGNIYSKTGVQTSTLTEGHRITTSYVELAGYNLIGAAYKFINNNGVVTWDAGTIVGTVGNPGDFVSYPGGLAFYVRAKNGTPSAYAMFEAMRISYTGYVGIGTTTPLSQLHITGQFRSTLADGTAPFIITSGTVVSNLNVDKVDGVHVGSVSDGKLVRYNSTGTKLETGTVTESAGALGGVTTIGMSGQLTNTVGLGTSPFAITSTTVNTNLNADLLDGLHGSNYHPNLIKLTFNYYDEAGQVNGTSTIPLDSTVPLYTEGTLCMDLPYTAADANYYLEIDAEVYVAMITDEDYVVAALFDDTTCLCANALYVQGDKLDMSFSNVAPNCISLHHVMQAGSTNVREFIVRVGTVYGEHWYFNGLSTADFGGKLHSFIKVKELRNATFDIIVDIPA